MGSSNHRFDIEERLAFNDGFSIVHENFYDSASAIRLDLIHDFHGFHEADRIPRFDQVAFLHKGGGLRGRGAVKNPDDGRNDRFIVRWDRRNAGLGV